MEASWRPGRLLLIGAAVVAVGAVVSRARQGPATAPVAAAAPQGAVAPGAGEAAAGGEVAARVAELERRLEREPGDVAGWRMLGWSRFNLGRHADAAAAYARAAALTPNDAELWSALGEARVLAGGGVGAEAEAAFRRALAIDRKDARARYFLAVKRDLAGDHRGAVDDWIALLRDSPPGAPWEASVRDLVVQVAAREKIHVAGRLPPARAAPPSGEPAGPPGTDAIPGPDPGQLAAAARMSPTEQDAMARGMVDRLAARLAADPRDAEGWIRLMRARTVLKDRAGATAALRSARATFGGDAGTLKKLDEAARALSVAG